MSLTAGVEIYAGTLNLTHPIQVEVTAAAYSSLASGRWVDVGFAR